MTTQAAEDYFDGDSLAASVWFGKYALRDAAGNVVEITPTDTHRRMAKEFARIELKYPNPLSEEEIFGYLSTWELVPQGSPMSALGNTEQIQSLSNCFVIESPSDSYGGIMLSDQQMVQIMKRRGGVGLDISPIRPKSMRTSNAAGSTDGIAVFMDRYSNSCREVAQGGRRGALMISISCMHPDIETFIQIKQDKTRVTGANISIRITDEFMRAVESDSEITLRWPVESSIEEAKFTKVVKAKDVWNKFVEANWNSAEPGVMFWDTILNNSMADIFASAGFKTISSNPCVPGDTPVLTSAGYCPIESLVGKDVDIWNGVSWSPVKPFSTGFNDTVVVNLSDGTSLRCTHAHEFLTWEGFSANGKPSKLRAEDLAPGTKLAKFDLPVVEVGEDYPIDAYSQGFYSGDGTTGLSNSCLYSPKYVCQNRLIGRFGEDKGDRRSWIHGPMLDKVFVPVNGNIDYCLNWFAGILDSDGCVTRDENGNGFQVSSVDKNFLLDIRLMLSRLGVRAKVVGGHKARMRALPDGKGGMKDYQCQDCWRLLIGNQDAYALVNLGLKTERLDHNGQSPQRDARQFVRVLSVEESEPCETFCFTENKLHQGTFNGIVTGQCSELVLSALDSCRLLLVNLSKFVDKPFQQGATFDYDRFNKVAHIGQRLMDDLVDLEIEAVDRIIAKVESDPEPRHVKAVELDLWQRIRKTAADGRRTGLGITALGDTIAMCGIQYGSDASIKLTETIYKNLAVSAHTESVLMAEERGAFPVCNAVKYQWELSQNHPFVSKLFKASHPDTNSKFLSTGRRNIALTTTAPAGSMSIMTQTTSGCEPVFMLSYKRRKKINPNDTGATVDFVDDIGDKWSEFTVYHHGLKQWMEVTGETNPTKSPYHKATSADLDWEKSVELQAAAQKWTEHAISKTCNLPNSVTKEQVSDLYFKAWRSGCKGFTIYRDGSRSGVLVATEPKKEAGIVTTKAPKRPEVLKCDIHRTTISGESYVMLVGLLNGQPYEVFCGLSKNIGLPKSKITGTITKRPVKGGMAAYDLAIPSGQDEIVISDVVELFDNPLYGAFTRTLSLSLRHGVPVQFVVEQLRKDKYSDMQSFAAAVARVMSKHYILDGTKATSEKTCAECKSPDLAYQSGCVTCMQCGNSKCG